MGRLIDAPGFLADDYREQIRHSALVSMARGEGDEEVIRSHVESMVRIAREEGLDEHEVEYAASFARRILTEIVAELNEPRTAKQWLDEVNASLAVVRGGGPRA